MPGAGTEALRSGVTAVSPRSFHLTMAWACAAVGVAGFVPSYWLPLVSGTSVVPALVHLHAAMFYSWLALFVVQSRLAALGRLARHRELGVVGVSLATAMVFVGVATSVRNMRVGDAAGFGDQARAFSAVPITDMVFFATLVTIALLNVRRRAVHGRLMLIATVSLLNAAIARLFLLAIGEPLPSPGTPPPPIAVTLVPGLLTDLVLVPALVHDKLRLGRVHPAYWIGGAALMTSQGLRPVIGNSDAWQACAQWLMRLI